MTRIVIITDSLSNSIAASQIIAPLQQYHADHPDQACLLISFERTYNSELFQQIQDQIPFAKLIIKKRSPFLGTWSLWGAQRTLQNLLKSYNYYHIVARGPLAGFLAIKSATNACLSITIQARSLLAQEYLFAHPLTRWYHPRTWFDWVRFRQLHTIEQFVYGAHYRAAAPVTIQAVSHALKHYLQRTYHTPATILTIAQEDIPTLIDINKVVDWRIQTRQELGIDQQATVYCYNGSIKPWQQPDSTITFFKQKLTQDATSVLLVLTHDIDLFKEQLHAQQINTTNYRIINCEHSQVYRYLSVADFGIIFREPHIVNWTARPTKVLEYQAVGLPIIHNNTIAMLIEKDRCCSPK